MDKLVERPRNQAGNGHFEVAHAGELYRVALKRVHGARRYTLRVSTATGDVVLTMPPRGSLRSAREFAEKNAAWIGARLKRISPAVAFEPGALVPLRGEVHVIHHRPQARGVAWVEFAAAGECSAALCIAGQAAHLPRRVGDYLKRQAKLDLEEAVARHCRALGLTVRSIAVRDTRSRWGSCSAKGALNFSWRLVMAPPFVLDYLAAHEVAHLVHLNHSKQFWAIVRRLAPATEQAEAWLRAHGAELHRYGAGIGGDTGTEQPCFSGAMQL